MFFGGFVYRREDCILLFVFMSVPLLFLSGVSWPGAAVPDFWKVVASVFPSTWGLNAYVRISSMGADLADVRHEIIVLWILAGVYFLMTCLRYMWEIRRTVGRTILG